LSSTPSGFSGLPLARRAPPRHAAGSGLSN
jgi:hypothetical protein